MSIASDISREELTAPRDWHQLDPEQSLEVLGSSMETGLSDSEAALRLDSLGPNQIEDSGRRDWLRILFEQLYSSLVLLLLVAVVISVVLAEYNDAIAIFAIVVLNSILGFWQDFKAERSLAELKKLSVPDASVKRDGESGTMAVVRLVPGDIVFLQTGYQVPADCRLLEQSDLAIDESMLTGESQAVEKSVESLPTSNLPLGDRSNIGFMSTMVTRGHAVAVVTATGMNTELGKIADSLRTVTSEPTPLQIKLGQLGRVLAMVAIGIAALVFTSGLLGGQPHRLMLMTALSMAVAIVPEGLPAVATVALAIGARRMFRRNALIRQLPAVETLGSVSVICSDKTGTLTQNRMTVTILGVADCQLSVQPESHSRPPSMDSQDKQQAFELLLLGGCLCNDAQLKKGKSESGYVSVGEPTERSLVEVAARYGWDETTLRLQFPRVGEIAFDSLRKRMTTVHPIELSSQFANDSVVRSIAFLSDLLQTFPGNEYDRVAFTKGATDSLLDISAFAWVDDEPLPLNEDLRRRIRESRDTMAAEGTRVLALAFRPVNSAEPVDGVERDMIFVGLFGISDPARPEAEKAVELCRKAGIRPIMITGDHPLTAMCIARQLGIAQNDRDVISGSELARLPQEILKNRVRDVSVFARVSPADKLNIVEALQLGNEVVAMTGDGVNDAPALKQANVGVAMGKAGTDVARQSADMVLLDDNFATIVVAVEQGRIAYDNVRKFVKYAMSGNVGEVLVMTIGLLFGMPLPLLPLQILWVNLVTDGLPGLAMAVEPAEKNTMHRKPVPLKEPVFNRRMRGDLIWIGGWICLASLVTGGLLWSESKGIDHWRTVIFTVLTLSQMANVFSCRSEESSLSIPELFQNVWLWAAVISTFLLQLAVIYWAPLQQLFHTCSLTLFELSICMAASLVVFAMIEARKHFCGKRS